MLRKLREGDRRPIRIPLHRQKLTFLQVVIASSNGSRFDAFGANVPFAKVTEWRIFALQFVELTVSLLSRASPLVLRRGTHLDLG